MQAASFVQAKGRPVLGRCVHDSIHIFVLVSRKRRMAAGSLGGNFRIAVSPAAA